ncbi:polysaccharide deacetylase family protein [Saccharopolyspora phatthalungensis]|uniref:polysaccharide deacetylase family protein n=1 Tax=Saccharopolyspora phatthalungensis TaxID=664693 RepID=UPI000A9C44EB|nr:polysaccharide deacetylase family protein [Saccharopolyspora phatthalungensis]
MSTAWPDQSSVAVMITVAYEQWSRHHWPVYAPMATSWPLPPGTLDLHSMSWADYGTTTGVWRLLDILAERGIRATWPTNALAVERAPEAVRSICAAGHEIAGHSLAQDVMVSSLDRDAELQNIRRCTAAFEELTGVRPRGWLSPRATASPRTAELLAQCGYVWWSDHNDHDLPQVVNTASGSLVAIMHSDVTDVRAASAGPRGVRDIYCDTFDYLLSTGRPEVLNVTVHAHVSGRPAMAAAFEQILDHIQSAGSAVWIATHAEIASWILEQHKPS